MRTGRSWSLRRFFVASAFGLAVLPTVAAMLLSIRLILDFIPSDAEAAVGAIGRSVALEVARYLNEPVILLKGLGALLEAGPSKPEIQAWLEAATRDRPEIASFMLLDGRGIVVQSNRAGAAAVGKDYSGQPDFVQAAKGDQAVLSLPYVSPTDGSVTAATYLRVAGGYGVVTLRLEELSAFISSLRISRGDRIAVTDGRGRVAAHTDLDFVREQRFITIPAAPAGRMVEDGKDWIFSTARIEGLGWHVVYSRDYREASAILVGLVLRLAIVGLATVLVAGLLAAALERSFTRPFTNLLSMIASVSSGEYGRRIPPVRVEEFSHIAEAFNAMALNVERRDAMIKADLEEKVVLLKEVHHRVKNNLQVVASLLNLGSGSIRDPQDALVFKASQDRVQSMALVHEILYLSTDLRSIDMALYMERFLAYLREAYPLPGLSFDARIGNLSLPLERALPCGLLVNELVTNSLKHGGRDGTAADIGVRLGAEGDPPKVLLEVWDSGPGLPPGPAPAKGAGLGMSLIESLARQLDARRELGPARPGEANPGLLARVSFTLGTGED
jgi:two-component sensor histidine kinase